MKSVSLLATGAAMLVAGSVSADFVGLSAVSAGSVGGNDVYHVFAQFNQADDVLLNFFNHQTTAGNQSGVRHNDFAGGSWNPNFTFLPDQGAGDSYVSMNGNFGATSSTALDPSFGSGAGTTIPYNAGWYNSNPGAPITAGSGSLSGGVYSVKIMQVALAAGDQGWSANLTAGWKQNTASTTALFGAGSYTLVPAPGAIALLGVAGLAGRRRR